MYPSDEAHAYREHERGRNQDGGQRREEVAQRRESAELSEGEHQDAGGPEEGELGVRGDERAARFAGEAPQRGDPAQHYRSESTDQDYYHGDGHRYGGGEREPRKEEVGERDRRDEQHGVEEDRGRLAVQRRGRARRAFGLVLLALGEKRGRRQAERRVRKRNGQEVQVGDAGQHDRRRGEDVEVCPERGEREPPSGPGQRVDARAGRGSSDYHVYEHEGPDVKNRAEHVAHDRRRRPHARAPAPEGSHKGPDLSLVAGRPDRIARDAQHEQYRDHPVVVRQPLDECARVEPPRDQHRPERDERDQREALVERARPRHRHGV